MTAAESSTGASAPSPTGGSPVLLGVVNLSPESMVTDSIVRTPDEALDRVEALRADGVYMIDLGGRSITPDAPPIDDAEEQRRLEPTARRLAAARIPFAVDTWSSETGIAALGWGAQAVNFTGRDASPELLSAVAAAGASLFLTYMPHGNAYEMRDRPYAPAPIDLVGDILAFFEPRIARARAAGVGEVIVDPNLGIIHPETDDFEKIHLQLDVVWQTERLRSLGCPLFFYAARKPERLARIMMASTVLHARPEYIRTHEPRILKELLRVERRGDT